MVDAVDILDAVLPALIDFRGQLSKLAETAIAASAEPDLGLRALLAEDFDDLRDQFEKMVAGQPVGIKGLVGEGAAPIRVPLKSGGDYFVAPFNATTGEHGLNVPPPSGAFSSQKEVAATLRMLDDAFAKVDKAVQTFKTDRRFIAERIDRLMAKPKE